MLDKKKEMGLVPWLKKWLFKCKISIKRCETIGVLQLHQELMFPRVLESLVTKMLIMTCWQWLQCFTLQTTLTYQKLQPFYKQATISWHGITSVTSKTTSAIFFPLYPRLKPLIPRKQKGFLFLAINLNLEYTMNIRIYKIKPIIWAKTILKPAFYCIGLPQATIFLYKTRILFTCSLLIWACPSSACLQHLLLSGWNKALQPHLRYDNQLISQRSPFPKGSFVCKILTLIWHVDIIKLMKCNCNEQVRHSICRGTLNQKDPSLLTC